MIYQLHTTRKVTLVYILSYLHFFDRFHIIANSSDIDITNVVIVKVFAAVFSFISHVSGAVFTQTLQAFDTYQVQARCPGLPTTQNCLYDLTGTEITASKPIHVFSGNVRAWVPDATGKSRDHLIEEILPCDR